MRLIDADALKRRAITVRFFGKDVMMVSTAEIDDAPTIDAVEVVRCKNCRWYQKGENEVDSWQWCMVKHCDVSDDEYCSNGGQEGGDEE